MDGRLRGLGDVVTRGLADRLDGLAALTQNDLLVTIAGDIDRLLDADRPIRQILPLFGLDRGLVGQFVVQALEHLLARHLRGEEAERCIGDLILRIKPWARRHQGGE